MFGQVLSSQVTRTSKEASQYDVIRYQMFLLNVYVGMVSIYTKY